MFTTVWVVRPVPPRMSPTILGTPKARGIQSSNTTRQGPCDGGGRDTAPIYFFCIGIDPMVLLPLNAVVPHPTAEYDVAMGAAANIPVDAPRSPHFGGAAGHFKTQLIGINGPNPLASATIEFHHLYY